MVGDTPLELCYLIGYEWASDISPLLSLSLGVSCICGEELQNTQTTFFTLLGL
jgi:hypothetical protein